MAESYHPPSRTLMGAGPGDTHPRVLLALSRPTIGLMDPSWVGFMEDIKKLLQYVFQTKGLAFPLSAPGHGGMECAFLNMVEPGDKVIIAQNGFFGLRMKENVERAGGTPIMVETEMGKPIEVAKVEAAFKANADVKVLAFVHAETSTGVASDAKALAALAHANGALALADCVTSLWGSELRVDDWGLDAVYSGSQKCLSAPPGMSPVCFSERAIEKAKNRKTKCPSFLFDLNNLMAYWGDANGPPAKRGYHHTPPCNNMFGLHEALVMARNEGLEASWARHKLHSGALIAGLKAMGLEMLVAPESALPQLNVVKIPEGVDDMAVRGRLLKEYGLEISAGLGALGGKVWRIGLMGYSAKKESVMRCLTALAAILADMGKAPDATAAGKAATAFYAENEAASRL